MTWGLEELEYSGGMSYRHHGAHPTKQCVRYNVIVSSSTQSTAQVEQGFERPQKRRLVRNLNHNCEVYVPAKDIQMIQESEQVRNGSFYYVIKVHF